MELGAGSVTHLIEYSPSMHTALGSNPSTAYSGIVVHDYNPSIWEVEAEGSEIQGYPEQQSLRPTCNT